MSLKRAERLLPVVQMAEREEQDAAGIGKDVELDEAVALAQLVHDGGHGFVLQESIVVQQ